MKRVVSIAAAAAALLTGGCGLTSSPAENITFEAPKNLEFVARHRRFCPVLEKPARWRSANAVPLSEADQYLRRVSVGQS